MILKTTNFDFGNSLGIEEEPNTFIHYEKIYSGFSMIQIEERKPIVKSEHVVVSEKDSIPDTGEIGSKQRAKKERLILDTEENEMMNKQPEQQPQREEENDNKECYQFFFHSCSTTDFLSDMKNILEKFLELNVEYQNFDSKEHDIKTDRNEEESPTVEEEKKEDEITSHQLQQHQDNNEIKKLINVRNEMINRDGENINSFHYNGDQIREMKKIFKKLGFSIIPRFFEVKNNISTNFDNINNIEAKNDTNIQKDFLSSRSDFLKNICSYSFLTTIIDNEERIEENSNNNNNNENQKCKHIPKKKAKISNNNSTTFGQHNFFTPPGTIIFNKEFFIEKKEVNLMMRLEMQKDGLVHIEAFRIMKPEMNVNETEENDDESRNNSLANDRINQNGGLNTQSQQHQEEEEEANKTNPNKKKRVNQSRRTTNAKKSKTSSSSSSSTNRHKKGKSFCSSFPQCDSETNFIHPIFVNIISSQALLIPDKFFVLGNSINKNHMKFDIIESALRSIEEHQTDEETSTGRISLLARLSEEEHQIKKKNLVILKFFSNDHQIKTSFESLIYIFFLETLSFIKQRKQKEKVISLYGSIEKTKNESRKTLEEIENRNRMNTKKGREYVNLEHNFNEKTGIHNEIDRKESNRLSSVSQSERRRNKILDYFSNNPPIKDFFSILSMPSKNIAQSSEKVSFYRILIANLIARLEIEKNKIKRELFL